MGRNLREAPLGGGNHALVRMLEQSFELARQAQEELIEVIDSNSKPSYKENRSDNRQPICRAVLRLDGLHRQPFFCG